MTGQIKYLVFLTLVSAAGLAHAQSESQSSSTEALFDRVNGSVCTIAATDTASNVLRNGSGFILKDSRLLVTNAHVLGGFTEAEVNCSGQTTRVKRITNYDGETDLVLAEIGDVDVVGLELAPSAKIRPGTQVYAFGSPYGLDGTITPGLTSGYRTLEGKTYIQISTPISPGSSGGPVTDASGAVIGITVAALEVAQNINFAIPATIVNELPAVDSTLSDFSARRRNVQAAAQPVERNANTQPSPRQPPRRIATRTPTPVPTSERAQFHGYSFGSQCGDIAFTEYEDKLHWSKTRGLTKFRPTYGGELEMDIELLGAPATVIYECSERYGLIGGRYEIFKHRDSVSRIEGEIRQRYGAGVSDPISEWDARDLGCRFNYTLAGSSFHNPSQRTLWTGDNGLSIELLICGGSSNKTFVFFDDTTLQEIAEEAEEQAEERGIF